MLADRFSAVFLDLFDTIVKWDPNRLPVMEIAGRSVHSTFPWLIPILAAELPDAFREDVFLSAYAAVMDEIESLRRTSSAEVTCEERFRRTVERMGAPRERVAELARTLRRRHMEGVRSVTTTPEPYRRAVERLAERYPLGLVSNFDDSETGHRIVADTGVSHLFGAVDNSADVAIRKPHPDIFRPALERLGVEPQRVLFVGDNAREDVLGAQGLSMPVAWLSHDRPVYPDELEPPDWTIRNLAELPALLGL